jgi:hypothetical protein
MVAACPPRLMQVHITGCIIKAVNHSKWSHITYVCVLRHHVDLPVVARRLFHDNFVRPAILAPPRPLSR